IRRTSAAAAFLVTRFLAASHDTEDPYPSASCPRPASNRDSAVARAAASFAVTWPSAASTSPCPAASRTATPVGPLRWSRAVLMFHSASATSPGTPSPLVHIPDHLPDAELRSGAGEPPLASSHPAFRLALSSDLLPIMSPIGERHKM